ncbi:GNAT family N-acetyltransferase [Wenzhouxiangella sp. EGI_FJ10409]|uniref:GNAT family N-acetyltransferase n=1 Tax=Wenzhouxiangella sp. EGI_FJ10409 TaxID=3243767 RepID=UPI0035D84477
MGKFRAEPITDSQAAAFWTDSPQATGFTHPDMLAQCADRVDWWGAWRSEDLVAVWPVCATESEMARPPIFLYYVGPMFSGEIHDFKYHRYQAIRQQALEVLIPQVLSHYGALRFSMPPGETDMRAFDWWNHDHADSGRFQLHVRQTARIQDLQRPIEQLRQDMARNRKRDLRLKPTRLRGPTSDWSPDEIVALHNEPMLRQDQRIPSERIDTLQRVIAAADNGRGAVLAWRDEEDGSLASVIVLIYGPREANDVLCVASERWRDRGLAAWTTWKGIQRARADGKETFDFNGANSPTRAADKHSYNARAEIYFNITYAPAGG